jgi:hypothetical protein
MSGKDLRALNLKANTFHGVSFPFWDVENEATGDQVELNWTLECHGQTQTLRDLREQHQEIDLRMKMNL